MEIFAGLAALLIGISLGLIGGGGSILTVPVLVYLMGIAPIQATAYSLFIVGMGAAVGTFKKAQKGLVDFKAAALFAPASILAVYLTRRWLLPLIPDPVIGLDKNQALMLLFALLMLAAAWAMIRQKKQTASPETPKKLPVVKMALEGTGVGILTGLVGAGGGFLIIPALVLWCKMPMKTAVGTSLFIIATKSLIGFLGDLQSGQAMDWYRLLSFTALVIVGIFAGEKLSNKLKGNQLKKAFGIFVLLMALGILTKELI